MSRRTLSSKLLLDPVVTNYPALLQFSRSPNSSLIRGGKIMDACPSVRPSVARSVRHHHHGAARRRLRLFTTSSPSFLPSSFQVQSSTNEFNQFPLPTHFAARARALLVHSNPTGIQSIVQINFTKGLRRMRGEIATRGRAVNCRL